MKRDLAFIGLLSLTVITVPVCHATAYISIIIDDLGYRLKEGQQLINLPTALTYAVLPSSPYGRQLATLAHQQSKEIMLHMPMQSENPEPYTPGMLTANMAEIEFRQTVQNNLRNIPYITGINNHMGSHLTRRFRQMDWLMQELAATDLYFVDSRTTPRTIAAYSARYHRIPWLQRDIFLDNDTNPASIQIQLEKLKNTALRKGYAVGIGHPHPTTLSSLEKFVPSLGSRFKIVPISKLIRIARIEAIPGLASAEEKSVAPQH